MALLQQLPIQIYFFDLTLYVFEKSSLIISISNFGIDFLAFDLLFFFLGFIVELIIFLTSWLFIELNP